MTRFIKGWLHRYFSDEEAVILLLLLITALVIVLTMGSMLAPVFAAMVLAFLLQGGVNQLKARGVSHNLAVTFIFLIFLTSFLLILLGLVPLIGDQVSRLFNELPRMIGDAQHTLQLLPQKYPGFISDTQVTVWIDTLNGQITNIGQWFVSLSLSSIPGFVGVLIYLVLVPILVFFFLKDSTLLASWTGSMLPVQRPMMRQVYEEMSNQIANYVRGKAIEILIVGGVTYLAFVILGVRYAALLGLLVGLSVVVPYIGAAVVTIPVAMIAFFQWGWGNEFIVLMVVYGIIQALDGNVLVPLLFSEAVNLHPIAIIVAVLVFGGLWGFWGVFFAIPLATLLKALMNAWPTQIGDGASDGGAPQS
ncbi:AI-2E family transporter [Aestuariirhabdus litorea]|uniref:AI-2E family transporter n=1 Tax=Aestuariirhabdus litorea TaxID=2528527 RepID=A0A3P3VS27_9GAMM|nr:AI-2E family transporter [Aestuariirhabdus litorea]RRJ85430.1 AI-2E family transporter [Aestuariirhabdus litorea]RWW97403.1 AI-2E family transporter [Endozoicomonadaceae bacterium GTF-13]